MNGDDRYRDTEQDDLPIDVSRLDARVRDLTRALRALEEDNTRLARQEAEQREMLDAMRDLVMVLDENGVYLQIPGTAPDLQYRPDEDLVGRRMHDVMPHEAADEFLAVIRQALRTGETVYTDYSLPIEGRTVWFSAAVSPMAGDRVLWVTRDVTAQHEAEAAQRASEERYRLLFAANPMPMWVYDRATLAFLAVNTAAERQYGFSAAEFLRMTVADIRPPEDVPRLRDAVAHAPKSLHTHTGWRHRRKDGSLIDVEIEAHPIEFDGRDAELVLAHDITARRRAEAALHETTEILRAVVDDSPLAIIATDTDMRITRWNAAAERLLGWSSAEMLGRSFELVVPESEEEAFTRARDAVLRGEAVPTYETKRTRKDGSVIDVTGSPGALRDDKGAVSGFVVILADITERRQLEQRLNRSQKMEALGQLAGGVAHDFNNLLTAITSYSQFLLDDMPPDSQGHADVTEILRAAERAAALTRQLLAFSRQQVIKPRPLSLNAIVRDVENMLRRLVREDIEFMLDLDPALGVVIADPGQIEQVLLNLVVNARDAITAGGHIMISTSNSEVDDDSIRGTGGQAVPAGQYVMLSVSDDGIGMTQEIQSRVFEPFFTTKEPGRGTGLGLATVYGIVQQAAGHITVYSNPRQGTSFKIRLPRADAVEPAPAPEQEDGPAYRGTGTVLLVEDDDAVRLVARRILTQLGYTLLEARGGAEALELAGGRGDSIDLVLTDMVMPGMSGPDLAGRLRARHPGLRILFMSGYSRDAAHQLNRFDAGTAYLEKPFTPVQLARRVRELLDAPDHT